MAGWGCPGLGAPISRGRDPRQTAMVQMQARLSRVTQEDRQRLVIQRIQAPVGFELGHWQISLRGLLITWPKILTSKKYVWEGQSPPSGSLKDELRPQREEILPISAGAASGQHSLTPASMMDRPHFVRAREAQTGGQPSRQELQNPNDHQRHQSHRSSAGASGEWVGEWGHFHVFLTEGGGSYRNKGCVIMPWLQGDLLSPPPVTYTHTALDPLCSHKGCLFWNTNGPLLPAPSLPSTFRVAV